jgi:uncharacterized protein YuzE
MQIEGQKPMTDISNSRQNAADFYDYDFENDSLFFNRKGVQLESSVDLGNVILDIGVDGSPIGFEILHASKMFKVSKSIIKNFDSINADIFITRETIEVTLTITVSLRNCKTPKIAISHGTNDINLPPAQMAMVF